MARKKSEGEDWQAHYHRALADYQNLQKRFEAEKQNIHRFSAAVIILKFLPILDNLVKAQKHLDDAGLDLVIKQFKDVLSSQGVTEMEVVGKEFNPLYQEAIEVVPGGKFYIVVEELEKGYMLGDMVLRPAKVKVGQ